MNHTANSRSSKRKKQKLTARHPGPAVACAESTKAPPQVNWGIWAPVLIVLACLAAYSNSLTGPLVFDGRGLIGHNADIRQLWPPWVPLLHSSRPVAFWTFALDYAVHKTSPFGYHVVNLAIHIVAALALYGVVRRTLTGTGPIAARYGRDSAGLALAVALLWAVHPLGTESVTYVYQRFESLMGLFCFVSLYGFIRAQESRFPNRWYAVSMACCLLAIGSKEVAAMLPVLLVWYDRAFLARSWRELVRRRAWFHGPLIFALAGAALYVIVNRHWYAGGGVLATDFVSPADYALSQSGVIVHYLRLCVWPAGQCIDYAWPVAQSASQVALPLILIAGLLALTVWAIFKRPGLGFLGGWFLLILAPTSSFLPIVDLAFEHRMYLPLAAVAVVVVLAAYELLQRVFTHLEVAMSSRLVYAVIVAAAATLLGAATFARNEVYQSEIVLWRDVVAKAPHNSRAHYNLAQLLESAGDAQGAVEHYRRTVALDPANKVAHNFLANFLAETSPDEALAHYQASLAIDPDYAAAHNNLAGLLARHGRLDEAREHAKTAVRLQPGVAEFRTNLALLLETPASQHGSRRK